MSQPLSNHRETPHVPGQALLSQLRRNTAKVVRVDADSADGARLKALGICVGRQIEIVKAGDPLIIRVVGARVGISAQLAAHVLVEATPAGTTATHAA